MFSYNEFRVFAVLQQNGSQTAQALVDFFTEGGPYTPPMSLGEVCDGLVRLVEGGVVYCSPNPVTPGEAVYDVESCFRGRE